jgi:hypothetical protein
VASVTCNAYSQLQKACAAGLGLAQAGHGG